MNNFFIQFVWSKFLRKIRGASIKNSVLESTAKVESGSSFYNSNIGRHSFCGYDCEISNATIGSFCSIASGVLIGGGRHPVEWISTSPVFYDNRDSVKTKYSRHSRSPNRRVMIGHDVWIGANAIIMQGVSIGTGAVVGAGSVVTKDVEPYAIVAGVPARTLRKRFDQPLIDRLLASRWWESTDDELEGAAAFAREPSLFLDALSK